MSVPWVQWAAGLAVAVAAGGASALTGPAEGTGNRGTAAPAAVAAAGLVQPRPNRGSALVESTGTAPAARARHFDEFRKDRTDSVAGTSAPAETPGSLIAAPGSAPRVQVLRSIGAVPPEIVGELREPAAYGQSATGQYFVFDRRGHGVYALPADRTGAWRLVQIGGERGRLLEPVGFGLDRGLGTFVVVDMPEGRVRLQRFAAAGTLLGGFYLPPSGVVPLTINSVTVSGPGAFAYTGHSILVSAPESGALVREYGMAGESIRSVGALRVTGQEHDPEVHQALNTGIPVAAPHGEAFYVFRTGVPAFRKYDASGRLLFERHIEGPELDPLVQQLPTAWPRKRTESGRELPLVPPTVLAAATDAAGNLWVSLAVPFTYVYSPRGDRIRIVQFRAAGLISPTSLFFAPDGRLLVTPGCYDFRP